MKIVVFGAGAIGSLFGALLSKRNEVILIGRKAHVYAISKNGLTISGKTKFSGKIQAFEDVGSVKSPDLLVVSVKSYDTENAMIQIKKIIGPNTKIISLQNGLDNVEKIQKHVKRKNIFVCITTNGAFFSKHGQIIHTGVGKTTLGQIDGKTKDAEEIVNTFNDAGIVTTVNREITREIWIKGIINSSINPLTTFFDCKNGYLAKNPVLKKIVEKICEESTTIANSNGFDLNSKDMIDRTFEVIKDTSQNYSSMLQSYNQGKMTEIDSINGVFLEIGKKNKTPFLLNKVLTDFIKEKKRFL